ncbi:hypothetical protein [Legionella londiniensis]|uniref:Uncharacterized protein n=1 Tax=Legionella londiniensis TaxID=45068 RepID=A0A0W0VLR6_9GAMM|nr:hypothetical protein [Legionella londiniensis]KTD21090.1 hypothetical protein Llon_1188 [Legionella londiniensis]STX93666.1 Uncharacterised protein [Legionella londiniensis]
MPNMSAVSECNQAILGKLKAGYDLIKDKWYKRLFFPSAMTKALEESFNPASIETFWKVTAAYFKHTWFFQRWIFSCLAGLGSSPFISLCSVLKKASLINFNEQPANNNFKLASAHADPGRAAKALKILTAAGLLKGDSAQANWDALARHPDAHSVEIALQYLTIYGLLKGKSAQANWDVVVRCPDPFDVPLALHELSVCGMLDNESAQAFRDAIARHAKPYGLAKAFVRLTRNGFPGLLKGEPLDSYWAVIANHPEPRYIAKLLKILSRGELLKGESALKNRNAAIQHANPDKIAGVLQKLAQAGLLAGELAQANFDALMTMQSGADHWVAVLGSNGILTQDNFNALIQHQQVLVGATEAFRQTWFNMLNFPPNFILDFRPNFHITDEQFNAIIAICRNHELDLTTRQNNIVQYIIHDIIRELLGLTEEAIQANIFNHRQTTHTASVHQSVSESAGKLKNRYGARNLEAAINEIKQYFSALSGNDIKTEAAKRCIERITKLDFTYEDPASQVSIRQLLAWSWCAIHDNENREGSFKDACNLFIEGLYEIQRGYNLSEENEDDRQEDKPTCMPGTFNKLVEKLAGIHPDCDIIYVTKEQANHKLKIVIAEETINYLKGLKELKDLQETVEALQRDKTVKPVWNNIKDKVAERMYSEFKSVYKDSKETMIAELIDFSEDMDVPEAVKAFIKDNQNKPKAQQGHAIPLANAGFFAVATSSANQKNNPQSLDTQSAPPAIIP